MQVTSRCLPVLASLLLGLSFAACSKPSAPPAPAAPEPTPSTQAVALDPTPVQWEEPSIHPFSPNVGIRQFPVGELTPATCPQLSQGFEITGPNDGRILYTKGGLMIHLIDKDGDGACTFGDEIFSIWLSKPGIATSPKGNDIGAPWSAWAEEFGEQGVWIQAADKWLYDLPELGIEIGLATDLTVERVTLLKGPLKPRPGTPGKFPPAKEE